MFIARREAGETQNHIEALVGKAYLDRNTANDWIAHYEKVMAGINSDNPISRFPSPGLPDNRIH